MSYIIVSVLALGIIALIASSVLYVCSRKFAVKVDPRVGQINELLPKPIVADVASLVVKRWQRLWLKL